jgi:hypothetical protein
MKKMIFNAFALLFISLLSAQTFETRSAGYPTNGATNLTSIVDNNIIWAISKNTSPFYFTTSIDGGNTWSSASSNLPAAAIISGITALSATTAYICSYSSGNNNAKGVFKTTDSGATWIKQTSATFNNNGSFPNFIHFFNSNNGVVVGDPIDGYFEIYTTTNGGTNWTRVANANVPNSPASEFGISTLYDIVGNTIWFGSVGDTFNGIANPRAFKSTDQGLTWTMNPSSGTIPVIGASINFSFWNATNGLLVYRNATNFVVARTNDGGLSYTELFQYAGANSTIDLECIPNTGTVFLYDGTHKISYDFGATFSPLTGLIGTNFTFLNWDTGFLTNENTAPANGAISKYSNTISIIGSNIGTPWTTDLEMSTVDGRNYTLNNLVMASGVAKFRQNRQWDPVTRSWGSTSFPSGIGIIGGPNTNIPITAGTYNISFNILTGAYNFQNALSTESFSKNNLKIYPNPSNSILNIIVDKPIITVSIADISGRSTSIIVLNNNYIDVSFLSKGIYFLEVKTDEGLFTEKFIKN